MELQGVPEAKFYSPSYSNLHPILGPRWLPFCVINICYMTQLASFLGPKMTAILRHKCLFPYAQNICCENHNSTTTQPQLNHNSTPKQHNSSYIVRYCQISSYIVTYCQLLPSSVPTQLSNVEQSWTILNNVEQSLTKLSNVKQSWTNFSKVENMLKDIKKIWEKVEKI